MFAPTHRGVHASFPVGHDSQFTHLLLLHGDGIDGCLPSRSSHCHWIKFGMRGLGSAEFDTQLTLSSASALSSIGRP
jgi:hypothetical protein